MKNRKSLIKLLSLTALLAVLIISYVVAKSHNNDGDNTDDDTNAETIYVTNYNIDLINRISYETDGMAVTLVKNSGGQWSLEENSLFPLKTSAVTSMISTVSTLTASRTVEGDSLSGYGLDTPTLKVSAEYSDGTSVSLSTGSENSYGIYLLDNGTGKIYLADSSFTTFFPSKLSGLIQVDKMPDIDTDYLVSLALRDKYENENTVTDEEGLSAAAEYFLDLAFSAGDFAAVTDEDGLSEYGITDLSPFAELTYKEENTVTNSDGTTSTVRTDASFKLIFGDRFTEPLTAYDDDRNEVKADQIMYYYTTPGSVIVYKADEATYEKLMAYATYTPAETDDAE